MSTKRAILKHQPRKKQLAPLIHASSHTRRSSVLSQLTQAASQVGDLETELEKALPPSLTGKIKTNSLNNGTLTVTCFSASHATMLKMNQAQIIKTLKSAQIPINVIKTQVRPKIAGKGLQKNTRGMTPHTGDLLRGVAATTEDEALRKIMMKLATHAPTR